MEIKKEVQCEKKGRHDIRAWPITNKMRSNFLGFTQYENRGGAIF